MTPRELRERTENQINLAMARARAVKDKESLKWTWGVTDIILIMHSNFEVKAYHYGEFDYHKHGIGYDVVYSYRFVMWDFDHNSSNCKPEINLFVGAAMDAFKGVLEKRRSKFQDNVEKLFDLTQSIPALMKNIEQLEAIQPEIKDW